MPVKFIIIFPLVFCFLGCASFPQTKLNYVALNNIDPGSYTLEFRQKTPEKLNIVNSIVFQYKWRSFTALGFTDLDIKDKAFAVSCMTPVGVKLFELIGDRNSVKANFVLKELLKKGDLPKAVGEDIRRIYFDNTPPASAKIKREKYKIIYTEVSGPGIIKYVFAGLPGCLIEKRYYESGRLIWGVFYYDYRLYQDKFFPAFCILKHYKFGYKLFSRIKEVRK